MPELPEVETIVRDLRRAILGARIREVWCATAKIIRRGTLRALRAHIVGRKITDVRRRAKNILIVLDRSHVLLIHQKMTGHVMLGKWRLVRGVPLGLRPEAARERMHAYIRLLLWLDRDRMIGLCDVRRFARIAAGTLRGVLASKELETLGPESLDPGLTPGVFSALVAKSRRPVKTVLLDQTVISGLGNIYSDEALWRARINPRRPAAQLKAAELNKLFRAIKDVLRKAIALRGTSMTNFRDAAGKPGRYMGYRRVYRRTGEPCPRCGAPIGRVVIGNRSAHYCPRCQRAR